MRQSGDADRRQASSTPGSCDERCSGSEQSFDRGARRLRRGAEVSARDRPASAAARMRTASATTTRWRMVAAHARQDGPGGIYNQLGGGFHRYSDRRALAGPALRKDALRQRAARRRYLEAYQAHGGCRISRGSPRETLDYVAARNDATEGGFLSALRTPTAKESRASFSSGRKRRSKKFSGRKMRASSITATT